MFRIAQFCRNADLPDRRAPSICEHFYTTHVFTSLAAWLPFQFLGSRTRWDGKTLREGDLFAL
jgi:hypothetical protein